MPLPPHTLDTLLDRRDLSEQDAHAAFSAIMDGHCAEAEIAALLTALRMKGEAVSEIVGAARAMQERVTPIETVHTGLLDTCGTGGDHLQTFNISTATAFVVAAAGVPVPKHGNRAVSSSSGSADVLEHLGVNINLSPTAITRCLDELKIGFCFAPLLHNAMKHAAPVRRQLRFRTIFNLLGPLTNPARAEFQLVGASRVETARSLAAALASLGRSRALVVCGADQLDEVSLWGTTTVFSVAGNDVATLHWTADTFGLPECAVNDLRVPSATESACLIREIFAGAAGAPRNIVLANAAAALLAARKCTELRNGVALAAEMIDSGRVANLVQRLAALTTAQAT